MEFDKNLLVQGPIDPEIITRLISSVSNMPEVGAHTLFLGKVRADAIDGKKVKKIIYSAYNEMVIAEALKIKKEILDTFNDVQKVAILHSIGEVNVGGISLLIFIASGHRGHAFRACQEIVEKIKERLPVWKKEVFNDNTHRWKGPATTEEKETKEIQ